MEPRSPSSAFLPFLGEASPTKIDYGKKQVGTLILTSAAGAKSDPKRCEFNTSGLAPGQRLPVELGPDLKFDGGVVG